MRNTTRLGSRASHGDAVLQRQTAGVFEVRLVERDHHVRRHRRDEGVELARAGAQVPVGLLGLAMNTMRVRGVMARAMAARSWPSGMGESAGNAAAPTPVAPVAWTAIGYTANAVLRVHGFEARLQEGFGEQHQQRRWSRCPA